MGLPFEGNRGEGVWGGEEIMPKIGLGKSTGSLARDACHVDETDQGLGGEVRGRGDALIE